MIPLRANAGITKKKALQLSMLKKVSKPKSFGSDTVCISADVVHIAFSLSGLPTGSSFVPQQKFVKFSNKLTGAHAVFACSLDASSGLFHVGVVVGEELKAFSHSNGEYDVSILVGDALVANPIEWAVGKVTIVLPNKAKEHYPLYTKSLLHESDNTLKALPEITHKMRPPAERASTAMSTAFTVLSVVPLFVFVGYVFKLRFDLKRLRSIWSVAFVLCLVASLALYLAFWLALDGFSFYDTIKYIGLLTVALVFTGRASLSSVVSIRVSESKLKKVD